MNGGSIFALATIVMWTFVEFTTATKSSVMFPMDRYFKSSFVDPTAPPWTKFFIFSNGTIVYQDANRYELHYDYASAELEDFSGVTAQQFDAITLYNAGRKALLGAIMYAPQSVQAEEVAVQFVSLDPLDATFLLRSISIVQNSVSCSPSNCDLKFLYFPTFELSSSIADIEGALTNAGIEVSSVARWTVSSTVYSDGWAFGALKHVPPDQIQQQFESGLLTAQDILLTDGVPAEIPPLAGLISLAPSTPNSHVTILAKTFGLPFIYAGDPEERRRVVDAVGQRVVLRVLSPQQFMNTWLPPPMKLVTFEEAGIDAAMHDILKKRKMPKPIPIQPMQRAESYSAPLASLRPVDVVRFGGKSSNFGVLFASIPSHTVQPSGLGFSFNIWMDFMKTTVQGTRMTLGDWIKQKLQGLMVWPADVQQLKVALEQIQDVIKDKDKSPFPADVENAILSALQDKNYGFNSTARLRFRSSTNVEDTSTFSGAGLYDSNSGCLADDLDADDEGPSVCQPEEPKEKGVLRAVRRTLASFYAINAVLARIQYGVNEDDVGMALCVHHNFPDEAELANGVVFVTIDGPRRQTVVSIVSQPKDNSVTNPEAGVVPETATLSVSSWSKPDLDQLSTKFMQNPRNATIDPHSSLLPVGRQVMEMQLYRDVAVYCVEAVAAFVNFTKGSMKWPEEKLVYDLEYKYLAPGQAVKPAGGLVIKQVRPVPQPEPERGQPILINEPMLFETLQGEHTGCSDTATEQECLSQSKAQLFAETRNMELSEAALQTTIFTKAHLKWKDNCTVHEADALDLPGYRHKFIRASNSSVDQFHIDAGRGAEAVTITLPNIPLELELGANPILFLNEIGKWQNGHLQYTFRGETTRLSLPMPRDKLKTFTASEPGYDISVHLYWTPGPSGPSAGWTYPLSKWVNATISTPTTSFTICSWWAMTYFPGHHNFWNIFYLEPFLDPTVSNEDLKALADAGIRGFMVVDQTLGSMKTITPIPWGSTPACSLGNRYPQTLCNATDTSRPTQPPPCPPAQSPVQINLNFRGILQDFKGCPPCTGASSPNSAPPAMSSPSPDMRVPTPDHNGNGPQINLIFANMFDGLCPPCPAKGPES
jgi:hypothetical protein|eukprot:CAMPEP_0174311736 /NCGR_PEP_ID=MMETSP0810-20121108/3878_1 /TAXON_ID=73025 ORGANISM="Eutreptiella gymnastica-like, Strain CCMP1594" /NCGR_SAMPLE_ID=MMETSP0810 /ASSEMBLY_ACC=CAM_ASM_000659 /LENGTH=1103 /DNA_ID=CAMNT_0015420007 /DNA_START=51 /DNA_END=3362 /DNA_ORIENTATION=+